MSAIIPRFLLPRGSAIWRVKAVASSTACKSIRNVSNKTKHAAASKPRVLEKPTKFNPPSHGSKLRKAAPRYPGPALSEDEVITQRTKAYPNMMPPPGTFLHWFVNNRSIHIYITLGTLFSLAGFTMITNFKNTSKFADMLPAASDMFFHPIAFTRTCLEVLRLHTAHISAETADRRKRVVDDVSKRGEFRKAHGLETEAFGGWTAKGNKEDLSPPLHVEVQGGVSMTAHGGSGDAMQQVQTEKKPLRKWLGIW